MTTLDHNDKTTNPESTITVEMESEVESNTGAVVEEMIDPMLLHMSKETLGADIVMPEVSQTSAPAEEEPIAEEPVESAPAPKGEIPRTVYVLGAMMFLMNCAFVMTYSFSGLYLKSLGAANVAVGFLEGLAEATSFLMKFFSGVISDALRRRKPVMYIGYALSVIARPMMAAAGSFGWFFGAKLSERLGNGIQATPRDAIVADVTPPSRIGAAYGLKRSIAQAGSIVGALLGWIAMWLTDDNMGAVFWLACVPSFVAFLLLTFYVKEPKRMDHSAVSAEVPLPATKRRHRISWSNLRLLGSSFWLLMLVNAIFMLARVSEQFLVIHAKESYDMASRYAPIVCMVYNLGYCLISYPVGLMADRINRYWFLTLGIVIMVLASLILATAVNLWILFLGILFWGFQMGITLNIFSSLIAETVPENLRGTGFGCYYIINAVAIILAETMAGKVADVFGLHSSFIVSAVISIVALIALIVIMALKSTPRKASTI
jgi:MFS family permease